MGLTSLPCCSFVGSGVAGVVSAREVGDAVASLLEEGVALLIPVTLVVASVASGVGVAVGTACFWVSVFA